MKAKFLSKYNNRSKGFLLFLSGLIMTFFSIQCKEKEKVVEENTAGRTGNLTLVTKMVHHTRPINGCRVFVKYNTTEFPGEDTTKYSYRLSADSDSPYAVIDSLAPGNYFIYAVGIDSLLDPSNWVCKGGLPFSTSQLAGTDSINIYITEGD